jgi:hypothetical protein
VLRQVRDWNIEITTNEGGKEQKQCCTGADAKAHIGIAQHPQLYQQEQDEE